MTQNISTLFTCSMLEPVRQALPPFLNIFARPEESYPLYIREHFFSEAACDAIMKNLIMSGDLSRAGVKGKSGPSFHNRESFIIRLSSGDKQLYNDTFEKFKPEIEAFFNVRFTDQNEGCHAILYLKGGKFGLHSDNCNPVLDENNRLTGWEVEKPGRVISTILILTGTDANDSTTTMHTLGGNLSFDFIRDKNNQPLSFKPQKGLFLAFPSHPCFAHQVSEVQEGFRASIVDWHFAVPG